MKIMGMDMKQILELLLKKQRSKQADKKKPIPYLALCLNLF